MYCRGLRCGAGGQWKGPKWRKKGFTTTRPLVKNFKTGRGPHLLLHCNYGVRVRRIPKGRGAKAGEADYVDDLVLTNHGQADEENDSQR
jgi:hypothetical protein